MSIHDLVAEKQPESFVFSAENEALIKKIIAKYPKGKQASAVMPLLDLAMRQCNGWIPEAAIKEVGKIINLPYIKVYEVATFYSMYNINDNFFNIYKKYFNVIYKYSKNINYNIIIYNIIIYNKRNSIYNI